MFMIIIRQRNFWILRSRHYAKSIRLFEKCRNIYYLATMDGEQPRVRPFGTAHIFEGKLYIQTGKVKTVSKQIAANPKV